MIEKHTDMPSTTPEFINLYLRKQGRAAVLIVAEIFVPYIWILGIPYKWVGQAQPRACPALGRTKLPSRE